MMIRASLTVMLTLCFAFTSSLSAQEKTKPAKGDKTDPPKVKPEPRKKISFSQKAQGILKQFDPKSNKKFTLDIRVVDPQKLSEFNRWKAKTVRSILQDKNPINRQKRTIQYQIDLAKRQKNIYAYRGVELQAAENIIVRSMFLPFQYDDKGNPKQYSKKEKLALWQKDKLPAYPADYDILAKNQAIQVYIASKTQVKTKKKGIPGITEPIDTSPELPRVVMIVVLSQSAR